MMLSVKSALSVILLSIVGTCFKTQGQSNDKILEEKAKKIHQKILTIDSHTDTPLQLLDHNFDISKQHETKLDKSCLDFPRMMEGGLNAAFFAIYTHQGKRTPEGNYSAKRRADMLFDTIYSMLSTHRQYVGLAVSPQDARRLKHKGKCAVFIGIENGYPIGDDLSAISEFYNKGARYITLCHNRNNDLCDSSNDTAEFNGLSKLGINAVKYMNKVGMMIDVSHASDRSFYDVVEISKAPVIASHSCSRAICDRPRNMSDDMLRALAKNGGVIQICILSAYVNCKDTGLATVSDVVDHIDHIVRVAGIKHIGIGTDFDGGGGVQGCMDVSQVRNITVELLRRGYSTRDIRKIWGGNLIRVMDKVKKVANRINPPCHC